MELQISNVSVAELTKSMFLKPLEIHYTVNGIKRKWDFIQCHDSVTIIIYNTTKQKLVCVRQFRPAVYINNIPAEERYDIDPQKYPQTLGMTLEFCAGIVDKNKSLSEIAREEILEECGYDVPLENVQKLNSAKSSVGIAVFNSHFFYAEVNDSMKIAKGGGLNEEGEFIEVVELDITEAEDILSSTDIKYSSRGFLMGLMWFINHKLPSIKLRAA